MDVVQKPVWTFMAYGLLLLAFVGRVSAQLLQYLAPVAWLPSYNHWHSSLLPYGVLLFFQCLIIAGSAWFLIKCLTGRFHPVAGRGKGLRILGVIYLTGAILRLVLGQTLFKGNFFFDSPIPAAFHIVLALMVLIWAGQHLRKVS
jgi:hypothetical protein